MEIVYRILASTINLIDATWTWRVDLVSMPDEAEIVYQQAPLHRSCQDSVRLV